MNVRPSLLRSCCRATVMFVCAWLATAPAMAETPVAIASLPGDSIYQTHAAMTNQDGQTFQLEERRGMPVLVSMFYNSCKFVCPMLIDTMELTDQGLTAAEKRQLSMLLVTFDPARDDVKTLKTVVTTRELDPARWTLARTDTASVRKIAATLGIQYRLLSDGEYNHTTVLVLLDAQGRIVGRTKKMGAADPDFIKLVKQTIQSNQKAAS